MTRPVIAVIGASSDRSKFGNKCVRAYLEAGYRVYPVNLHEQQIEGLPVLRSVKEVPTKLDRISIYLPPAKTRALLPCLAEMHGVEVWFNPGSADDDVLDEARVAGIDVHDGCSIVAIGMSPGRFD